MKYVVLYLIVNPYIRLHSKLHCTNQTQAHQIWAHNQYLQRAVAAYCTRSGSLWASRSKTATVSDVGTCIVEVRIEWSLRLVWFLSYCCMQLFTILWNCMCYTYICIFHTCLPYVVPTHAYTIRLVPNHPCAIRRCCFPFITQTRHIGKKYMVFGGDLQTLKLIRSVWYYCFPYHERKVSTQGMKVQYVYLLQPSPKKPRGLPPGSNCNRIWDGSTSCIFQKVVSTGV